MRTVPTVTIVDPDRVTGMLLREICQAGGWNVVGCALNVHDGMALLARTRPAYLITEYKFEGCATGLDLIAQGRRVVPNLFCVLLTGWDINDVAAHITAHQPDRILRKPVPPHVLMDLLQGVDARVEQIRIEAI
jgi:DNA-binding NarL/FixJ family response regulator